MPINRVMSAAAVAVLISGFSSLAASPSKAEMAAMTLSEGLSAEERDAVKAMFEGATDAMLADDLKKWETYWSKDAVLMPPGHPSVTGHAALMTYASENYSYFEDFKLSNWTFEGSGDLAVVTTDVSFMTKGGEKMVGKQVVIAKKETDGAWKAQKVI